MEVEEYLRAACIQKYSAQKFWDYLICRSKNIASSWWEDCLQGEDSARIKKCAQGQEGIDLLKENVSLNKEMEIFGGPSYLVDNRIIFSSKGVPDKEELRKILKKK
jgi:hypothetical protein